MTEEEKEVLETLKILVDKKYGSTSVIERNDLKTLLNLIDKLQKEILDKDVKIRNLKIENESIMKTHKETVEQLLKN